MVQQLWSDIERLKAEVARLRGKLDSIAVGNQVILNPNTGQSSIPPPAAGALIYGTAAPLWGRREIGAEGDVLQVQSGFPVWDTAPAGTPADTVTDETTYGISPDAGASTEYSRGDHTHGSPTTPGAPPFSGARVYNSSNESANNVTETALTFNSERYDVGGYHSTVSATSKFTAPVTGYYHIGGNVYWDSNTVNSRDLYIKLNGTTIIAIQHGPANPPDAQQNVNCDYFLSSGDYVELFVYQDSGGTRTISVTAARSPEFWIHLIGV